LSHASQASSKFIPETNSSTDDSPFSSHIKFIHVTKINDVSFVDVGKKFEEMANNKDKDDTNQNSCYSQISEK